MEWEALLKTIMHVAITSGVLVYDLVSFTINLKGKFYKSKYMLYVLETTH